MGALYTSKDTPIRIYNARSKMRDDYTNKMKFLIERNKDETKHYKETKVYQKFMRLTPHLHRAGTPRRSFEIIKDGKPEYSMTVMFSRRWAVKRYFDMLKDLEIPTNTEYLCLIDTNDRDFTNEVVRNLERLKDRFVAVSYYTTNNARLEENSGVTARRQRIVDNWDLLMPEIRGHTILATEDDSLPQQDAYTRLLKRMRDEDAHFVQGNILGRWGTPMNPAWKIDGNPPQRVWTPKQRLEGFEQIQGVGWYCFVADTVACRKYVMSVNDDVLPFGPDLRFGHKLALGGYKLLHDWEVHVLHFGQDWELRIGKDPTRTLDMVMRGGKWVNR